MFKIPYIYKDGVFKILKEYCKDNHQGSPLTATIINDRLTISRGVSSIEICLGGDEHPRDLDKIAHNLTQFTISAVYKLAEWPQLTRRS